MVANGLKIKQHHIMQLSSTTLLQGGKYRIEKVLGQGGFGITYLAVQVGLNRKVAIKEFFMKEYCNRDAETSHVSIPSEGSKELVARFRQKFIKEAQTIAGLNHPHIIRIHDIFEENGTAYYVMEFHNNGSLSELIKQHGSLPEVEALRYIREVADALAYIHEHQMNHLDVKPGNVLLDEKGRSVLIDFGLSKRYDESGQQTSTTPVGISHGYAPMEQYKQGGVGTFSPATDIYSLGATLYKLLTGKTPPDASDVFTDGLPTLPSSVSSSVANAIAQAMTPNKKGRPQSVVAFLALLDKEPVVVDDEETILEIEPKPTPAPKLQPQLQPTPKPAPQPTPTFAKKKWLVPAVAVAALFLVIYLFVNKSNSAKLAQVEADRTQYLSLISSADSLKSSEATLSDVKKFYDSAAAYEKRYVDTRYSDFFNRGASSSSKRIQSQMDSIAESHKQKADEETQRKLMATEKARKQKEEAEKARVERERVEKERVEKECLQREENEKKRQETFKNGVLILNGVEYPMVRVSGGSFMMGCTEAEDNEWYSLGAMPQHRVSLSSYSIGKYPVTNELWEAVTGDNLGYNSAPVTDVSWYDCMEFIDKLNKMTGMDFKLPTEAQWEFAARGGNKSRGYKYSGSNDVDKVAWYEDNIDNNYHFTKPVGLKSPNELGIYDMSGNVSEWCSDWRGEYSSVSQTDPKGPNTGTGKVARGGTVMDNKWSCRVFERSGYSPDYKGPWTGFRLCL